MKPAWFRVAALLAVVLPCVPQAFEWSGRAGAIYSRDDQWTPTSGGTTVPRLDIDLALDGKGYVYTPDALTWGAGVGYRRFTASPSNAASTSQNIVNYRLNAVAFGRRGSPFTLSGFGSRSEGDGTASVGSYGTTEQTYGGTMILSLLNRPNLQLGYTHTEGTYTSPLYPSHESRRDALQAATSFSTSAFGYDIRYHGNFATGTYDGDNHDDHRVEMNSRIGAFKTVTVQIADTYSVRLPTRSSIFNPRQEMNAFTVFGRHDTSAGVSTEQVRYSHSSGLTESLLPAVAPASPTRSVFTRTLDGLDLEVRRPLSEKEWSLVTTLSANYSDFAEENDDPLVPDLRVRTAGQSVSPIAYWARQDEDVHWNAHAGPSFGLVEPFDGSTEFGWGASAGASVYRQFSRVLAGTGYSIAYAKGVGTPTTSLAQNLSGSAEGGVGGGRLRAVVTASSERTNAPLIGSTASRALRANVDFGQRNYGAFAEVQLRDGVAFPLRDSFRGDGLFLSPSYDSRSTAATTGLRGAWSGLTARGSLGLRSVVMRDRPSEDDLEARAELSYRIGAFSMGFDERYLLSLRDRSRANVIFFRVYRLLGSRY